MELLKKGMYKMDWSLLNELLKVSPYAVLLVLGFYLFFKMHKHSVEEIEKNSKNFMSETRHMYKDALDAVSQHLKK